jgi:CopG family nickel-responsive transcriptional regulator
MIRLAGLTSRGILSIYIKAGKNTTMSRVIRFGVSLEAKLLKEFDALVKKTGYGNRSEAIRDLIRARLVEEEWKDENKETVGILGIVYDHSSRELMETLTRIQHNHIPIIISSVHVHLDQHNCLEVIVLKGKSGLIKKTADQLLVTRNVKHGKFIMTTTGIKLT